jgi:hypothetical protein
LPAVDRFVSSSPALGAFLLRFELSDFVLASTLKGFLARVTGGLYHLIGHSIAAVPVAVARSGIYSIK